MKTFLSSTYVDLVEHRKAAGEALERLGQQAGRMEVFGARPEEPIDACLNEIDECDLFVGIYAYRYGYIPEGSDVSITEAEFDHAKRHNKPVFCFLIDKVMKKVEDKLANELKTGAKVICYGFKLPNWQPDDIIYTNSKNKNVSRIFIYTKK